MSLRGRIVPKQFQNASAGGVMNRLPETSTDLTSERPVGFLQASWETAISPIFIIPFYPMMWNGLTPPRKHPVALTKIHNFVSLAPISACSLPIFFLRKGILMIIAIPKETAEHEIRVALLPNAVRSLVQAGHEVWVEKNAAFELGHFDREYESAGAKIVTDRAKLFGESRLVVKLKAPSAQEFALLNNNLLFSMLHHEQNPEFVQELGRHGVVAVEMESLKNDADERLVDATDITGEVGVLYACQHLRVMPQDARALVLGYGRVGSGAITMASKLGMDLKILRKSEYPHLPHFLKGVDLLINAISWPVEERAKKKYLVTQEMLDNMNPNGVVLDLSVDFPNPIQTCRPTTLSNPWYREHGKVHIGIYGYPGLVPVSCTRRYSEQILPIVRAIADHGSLDDIESIGDLGHFIARATVRPEALSWRSIVSAEEAEQEKSYIE